MSRFTIPIKNNQTSSKDVTVIILSSIPGYRMKVLPNVSLMPVDKQHNVLQVQIQSILTVFPLSEILITVGYDKNSVLKSKPKFVRAVENQLYENYSEVEELRLAVNNVVTDRIVIMQGNILFNEKSLAQINRNHSSTLLSVNDSVSESDLGVVVNVSNIENISYGLKNRWIPIVLLQGKELILFKNFINKDYNSKLCFFEAINHVLDRKGIIYPVINNGYIKQITNTKEFNENSN